MTETEHAELSRRLALAIGYYPESVRIARNGCEVFREYFPGGEPDWRTFSYGDPSVALPVLAWLSRRYGVSRIRRTGFSPDYFIEGYERHPSPLGYFSAYADTLPECIARAAIVVEGLAHEI